MKFDQVLRPKLLLVAAIACTSSACGQRAPEPPLTVSDFCLNDRRLSVAIPADLDDPGNRFDTSETVTEVLAHNEVYDRLCPTTEPGL